jgi:branched-subunit amino acid ABC-type transport system permease component
LAISVPDLLVQLLGGLASSAILFLVAAGITLTFGAMRIVNIAHGSFYMYGAFMMVSLLPILSGIGVGYWSGLAVATLLVGLMGAAIEIGVLRRIYAREHLSQLLATFALSYIFADLAVQIWGAQYRSMPAPAFLAGQVLVLGRPFPAYSLFVIAVSTTVGALLLALLQMTMFGWRVRAAVEDPELLAATGTNVALLSTLLFTLGAALAGLAGAIVAPLQAIAPGMDASIMIASFIVAIVGGLGSVAGAALGAVLIGVFQAFGVVLLPQWSSTFIYVAMILMLVVRPAGILGRAE